MPGAGVGIATALVVGRRFVAGCALLPQGRGLVRRYYLTESQWLQQSPSRTWASVTNARPTSAADYATLREKLMNAAARPLPAALWRRGIAAEGRLGTRENERFLGLLRDVNFEVPHGEAVGIIGRNGRGQVDAPQDPVAHHPAKPTTGQVRLSAAGWAAACSRSAPVFIPS